MTSLAARLAEIRERRKSAMDTPWHIGHVSQISDTKESADIDDKHLRTVAHVFDRVEQTFIASAPTDISFLLSIVEEWERALQVYALTNETFPEYGDVARSVLAKAEELASR